MQQPIAALWREVPSGAQILRLYGDTPCPAVPAEIEGRPVTEIGPYCFSDRREPEGGRWYAPDGMTRENAHPICGNFVEEVHLPNTVHALHNGAFYNCRALRRVWCGATLEELGSDMFTNCRALDAFVLRCGPDAATGLKKLLAAVAAGVGAEFQDGESCAARLYFPEYLEYLHENTPAHLFNHSIEGVGYRYRQCFADGAVQYGEYDAAFALADADEAPEGLCRVAMARLLTPHALDEDAKARYAAYLTDHPGAAVRLAVESRDAPALAKLGDVLPAGARRDAALACARTGWSEGAALLLAGTAETRRRPAKKTYDFDDL